MRPPSSPFLRRFSGWLLIALLLGALAAQASPVLSQSSVSSGGSTIYRLSSKSTFAHGCFAPCMCAMMEQGAERGTFILSYVGFDGLYSNYRIRDVNWTVSIPSGEVQVTGSGTYRVGGEFAIQQRLEMDLQVGSNPVEHFDSGFVAGGGFPQIAITISIHGQYCFDTVFGIDAAPVPDQEIIRYRLSDSTFQRGCFDLCDCAIGPLLPLRGSFALVPLRRDPLFTLYSVVLVDWKVGANPNATSASELPIQGFGEYRLGGEFAIQQQMAALLRVGTESAALYDSGLVAGGGSFPVLDITLVNGANQCVRTELDLHAKPMKARSLAPPPPGSPF